MLAGALLALAFLPAPLGFVAWFAFVPLLRALDRRVRAGASAGSFFRLGYAFGFAFYLVGVHWIALLSDVAITVPWLKYPAWLAAALYLALFPALATTLAGVLARRGAAALAVTFPIAWVAVEELRASGELGFPWFQAGYTQHAYGTLIQMASLGSVSFVTAWVALLNVLIWRTLGGGTREARGASGTPRALPAAGAALALLLPWAWGHQVLRAAPGPGEHAVALVQGDIAGEIKWSGQHQQAILDTFLALSARAVADAPEPILVIWPETATGSYLRKQPEQAVAVLRFARDRGVPVFSGFADYRLDERGRPLAQNAAGRFGPDGESREVYAKRHLVPFGERMPFQWLVPALGRIELGQAEWEAGSRSVLFASPAGPFACLICFEAIFPSLARDDVRGGARWLVNITNDEWFGNSAALYQHAAMAVFRAVENHVPLARCANTGLTILVDANGRVTRRLPVFTPATLVARLGRPGPATWYTRLGDWPGWLAVAAALVLALRRRPR